MTELNDLLSQELDTTRKRMETVASQWKAAQELHEKLSGRLEHLEALRDIDEDLQTNDVYVPIESETPPKNRRSRKKERAVPPSTVTAVPPSTVTLEEILRQKGPIHITAIIPIAEGEGVNLKGRNGTTAPYKTLRDKLNGSSRFHNFGGNVWGLPSQTLLPETNGHANSNEIESEGLTL